MDFIPGNTFRQYLDAGNVFPEKSVIKWAKQICSTLCYMHGQKPAIIHGDLKPANIMLMPDGNICLIDFNISAILDGSQAWVTGYTNGYAPPEQIEALNFNQRERDYRLWKKSDPRSDIYSLGATLYQADERPAGTCEGHTGDRSKDQYCFCFDYHEMPGA